MACKSNVGVGQNHYREVLFTSESSGQLWNSCVWDLHSGTVEHQFKGGVAGYHSICLVNKEYLFSAELGKPLLHYWPMSKKDCKQTRIVVPGKVAALTVTPDGNYCVAAIGEKAYIWQLTSGFLLAIVSSHYQPIRCLCITTDGSHLLTGGDDSLVHCWSIASLVDQTSIVNPEPRYVWSNHSLPVTSLSTSCHGSKARVLSTSLDQSCRMYDISTGKQVGFYLFDVGLTQACLSNFQSCFYVGTVSGVVYQVGLYEHPVKYERHVNGEDKSVKVFEGHLKEITCLALNLDATVLASGSKDMTVKLWHTASSQCVRTITHKGVITNAFITHVSTNLLNNFKPSTIIKQLQRHKYNSSEDNEECLGFTTHLPLDQKSADLEFCKNESDSLYRLTPLQRQSPNVTALTSRLSDQSDVEDLKLQLQVVKDRLQEAERVNREIYQYSLSLIRDDEGKS